MFYQGDLQSGISKAIQEQKLVACLVRQDDNAESTLWEDEWLNKSLESNGTSSDTTLGSLLSEKAVLLRMDAGSKEAGFLSAFCSLEKIPKLLIIRNGQVLEDIEVGTTEDDFLARVIKHTGIETSTAPTTVESAGQAMFNPAPPANIAASQAPAASPPNPAQQQETPTGQTNQRVQRLLAERSARLEKEKQKQEQAEREARKAVAKARKEEADRATASSSTTPAARRDYVEQQRDRLKEARLEKERILKSIESDRAARKEREAQRRMLAQAEATTDPEPNVTSAMPSQRYPSTSTSSTCSLQIRLFDGTSLRSRFNSDATLSASVRTYISEQSKTDIPYSFRQMLTPQPSRNIDVGEENESLQALGLCPSATLVLVPVKTYADAYYVSGGRGIINRSLTLTHGLVYGAYGMVSGLLGRVTGYGSDGTGEGPYVAGTGDEMEPSNVQGSNMAGASTQPESSSGMKIRTLADQRREDKDNEFYNGNQLNFQPRKKDNDEDGTT